MTKSSFGQPSNSAVPEDYNVQVVRRLLALGGPLESTPRLLRMGDGAAVSIMRVFGTRPPVSDAETLTALEIIQKAYERPEVIFNDSDRGTGATLFLLQYLSSLTQDEGIKDQIIATRLKVTSAMKVNPTGTSDQAK